MIQQDIKQHWSDEELQEQKKERIEDYLGFEVDSVEAGMKKVQVLHEGKYMVQTEYRGDGSIEEVCVDEVEHKHPRDVWKAIEYSQTTQTFDVEFKESEEIVSHQI